MHSDRECIMAACNPAKANSTDESGTPPETRVQTKPFLWSALKLPPPLPPPPPQPKPKPPPPPQQPRRRELPARAWACSGTRQASAHAACPAQTSRRPAGRACFHYDFSPYCPVRGFTHGLQWRPVAGLSRGRTRVCRPAIAGTAGRRLWANCTRTALVPAGRLGTMPITRHSGQDSAMRMQAIAASS